MKVLMINGSPRANGNTSIALNEMKTVFEKEGVDAEIVQVGSREVSVWIVSGEVFVTVPVALSVIFIAFI